MKIPQIIQIKQFIEEHSPDSYSILLALPLVLYVVGYLIWGVYMFSLGFEEGELLRSTYIMTGLIFAFSTVVLMGIYDFIHSVFIRACNLCVRVLSALTPKLARKLLSEAREWFVSTPVSNWLVFVPTTFEKIAIVVCGFLLWFAFYVQVLFPMMPSFLGGAKPHNMALLASEQDLAILATLAITRGEGATYQTENLCVIGEDSRGLYVLKSDRVIFLESSLYNGVVSLPGPNALNEQRCIEYSRGWVAQGLGSEWVLFSASLINTILNALHIPQIHLTLVPAEGGLQNR